MQDDRPHVPMPFSEVVSIQDAAEIARVSGETVRRWAGRYRIGRQHRGEWQWQISLPGTPDGDEPQGRDHHALETFRAGNRAAPEVAEYLDRAKSIKAARQMNQ